MATLFKLMKRNEMKKTNKSLIAESLNDHRLHNLVPAKWQNDKKIPHFLYSLLIFKSDSHRF